MAKRFFFTALCACLLPAFVWAQTATTEPAVKICNRTMRNMYVDILKLKPFHEELKNFAQASYDAPSQGVSSIRVDTRIFDTDGIRYVASGSPCAGACAIDIHFSRESCEQGCLVAPTLAIHSRKLNNYLVVYLEGLSPRLTNELLRIIRKNATDIK